MFVKYWNWFPKIFNDILNIEDDKYIFVRFVVKLLTWISLVSPSPKLIFILGVSLNDVTFNWQIIWAFLKVLSGQEMYISKSISPTN